MSKKVEGGEKEEEITAGFILAFIGGFLTVTVPLLFIYLTTGFIRISIFGILIIIGSILIKTGHLKAGGLLSIVFSLLYIVFSMGFFSLLAIFSLVGGILAFLRDY